MAYDVERRPGDFAISTAESKSLFVWLMLAAMFVSLFGGICALVFLGQTISADVLLVASLAFAYAARESIPAALNWLKGANAEDAVGAELNELQTRGYYVMHDVMFGGRGNLDHLVAGPNGVFLIETKFRRYENRHLGKLKHQARLIHDELDHWVVPIICAGTRAKPPYQHNRVWIAGRGQLAELIERLPGKPVDFERLARFADLVD